MDLSERILRFEAAQGPYHESFQALSLRQKEQRSLEEPDAEPPFVIRWHLFGSNHRQGRRQRGSC